MDKMVKGQKVRMLNDCSHGYFKREDILTFDKYSESNYDPGCWYAVETGAYGSKIYVDSTEDSWTTTFTTKTDQPEKPKVGLRHNSNKPRWRNFPLHLVEPVVLVGSHAELREGNPHGKYPTYNFLKGLSVADTLDSLKRHLVKLDDPTQSDLDDETGQHHLAHIAWNALVALHFIKTRPDLDDRYKPDENN